MGTTWELVIGGVGLSEIMGETEMTFKGILASGCSSQLRLGGDESKAAAGAKAVRLIINGFQGTKPVASKPDTTFDLVKDCLKDVLIR